MPHINTGPGEGDPTVSAYIIRTDTPKPSLLLHVHRKIGMYMQYGGHVDPPQQPWKALVDEIVQESGYDLSQLMLLQPKPRMSRLYDAVVHPVPFVYNSHPFPGLDHFHSDLAYAFVTDQAPNGLPEAGESNDSRLFTSDELVAIPAGRIVENVREIGLFVLREYIAAAERVDPFEFEIANPAHR
jgi:8-oxo-dGTP diphosphatase